MIVCNNIKLSCYHITRLLAHVLANKTFTFLQSLIIIYTHIIFLGKIFHNNYTLVIENIRINSYFFFKGIDRLEAVNSASTFDASTYKKIKTDFLKTKKFQLKWWFLYV